MPRPAHVMDRAEHARFMRNVTVTDECWLWKGPKTPNGYGKFRRAGQRERVAHRIGCRIGRPLHNLPGAAEAAIKVVNSARDPDGAAIQGGKGGYG